MDINYHQRRHANGYYIWKNFSTETNSQENENEENNQIYVKIFRTVVTGECSICVVGKNWEYTFPWCLL